MESLPCLLKKLKVEKGFPDLCSWSPLLVWRKNWKWRKDFLDLSSGSPSLVWRLKRPNAYQPGQRSHYHTVIRKSFLDTSTSHFYKIQGLIQDMKFVFLKILSVWRNGRRRKWWRIDTWKAHWPSLRPNGDRCSFSSPSYADPSTHVVINNHQESSYLRYIPLHHRHRIACSDLDKNCWTRFKPISIVGKKHEKDKNLEQKIAQNWATNFTSNMPKLLWPKHHYIAMYFYKQIPGSVLVLK